MISISLCMIVKDEEEVIGRCLGSVKDIVDEIIVVDTGSTDKTKGIVKKYTSEIYDFQWIDDFAAARNYSFSKATKDYIMWLDADDVVPEEDAAKLKDLKISLDPSVDVVMMKYNTGFDENGNVTLSYFRERLFKRTNNYKWNDCVHEFVQPWGNIIEKDICIAHRKTHKGYSDRNLRIYESMEKKGINFTPRNLYYYARELYYNKKYDEAIKTFEAFLASEKGWVEDNISACFDLSICYSIKSDRDNRLKTLLRSFQYDLPRAEICCLLGYFYKDLEDYNKALFWFELATKLAKPDKSWGFVLHDYWGYIPYIELCVLNDKLGNKEEAIICNEKAAEYKPQSPSVQYNRDYFKNISNTVL